MNGRKPNVSFDLRRQRTHPVMGRRKTLIMWGIRHTVQLHRATTQVRFGPNCPPSYSIRHFSRRVKADGEDPTRDAFHGGTSLVEVDRTSGILESTPDLVVSDEAIEGEP